MSAHPPANPDLLWWVSRLTEGTTGQREQAWKALSSDAVWRGCAQAARAGEVTWLLAVLARCEELPRQIGSGGAAASLEWVEARCVGMMRLLTAAVLAAVAQRGATAEEFVAWVEWAVQDAPQPPLGPVSNDSTRTPVVVLDAASLLLSPGDLEWVALREAASQLLEDRPEDSLRLVLARERTPLLLLRDGKEVLGWLWGERVGNGTGALLHAPAAWLDPIAPETHAAIQAAWELVQRTTSIPAGNDVRWWVGWFGGPATVGSGHAQELGGRSLQAAAATLFYCLCAERPCDAAVVVSAELAEDGALRGVEGLTGLAPKLPAALELVRQFGAAMVVVSEANRPEPRLAAEWASRNVRLLVAREISQVWEIAAQRQAVPLGSEAGNSPVLGGTAPARCRRLHFAGLGSAETAGYAQAFHALLDTLRARGYQITTDAASDSGLPWARGTEAALADADCVVAVLTGEQNGSEVLEYQLQLAAARWHAAGKPRLLPLDLAQGAMAFSRIAGYLTSWRGLEWRPGVSPEAVVVELVRLLQSPLAPADPRRLAPPGGALPPDAPTSVVRRCDEELSEALDRGDAIVRLRGARQIGKTSLLVRGLARARTRGQTVLFTDFQALDAASFTDTDAFYQALAQRLQDQIGEAGRPLQWDSLHGPSWNLRQFLLRDLLARVPTPVVWAMDEVDLLFGCPHAGEFFGLVRSWHNERAASPSLAWSRLTVALSYATEAHLTIPHTQSPFNVGTRIFLEDLSPEQVAELNELYGAPLSDGREIERLHRFLGGQPYLTHQGLHYLAARELPLAALEQTALSNDSPFSDHLRRLLLLLARDEQLQHGVLDAIGGRQPEPGPLFRLMNAGVVAGDGEEAIRLRCELYTRFFQRYLRA